VVIWVAIPGLNTTMAVGVSVPLHSQWNPSSDTNYWWGYTRWYVMADQITAILIRTPAHLLLLYATGMATHGADGEAKKG